MTDYSRRRHAHPDDVSCADAGEAGHPPYLVSLDLARERRRQQAAHANRSRDEEGFKVPGSVKDGPYLCTACGARFAHKERQINLGTDDPPPALWGLDDHWAMNLDCKAALTRPAGMFGAGDRGHCNACHNPRAACAVHHNSCPVCRQ